MQFIFQYKERRLQTVLNNRRNSQTYQYQDTQHTPNLQSLNQKFNFNQKIAPSLNNVQNLQIFQQSTAQSTLQSPRISEFNEKSLTLPSSRGFSQNQYQLNQRFHIEGRLEKLNIRDQVNKTQQVQYTPKKGNKIFNNKKKSMLRHNDNNERNQNHSQLQSEFHQETQKQENYQRESIVHEMIDKSVSAKISDRLEPRSSMNEASRLSDMPIKLEFKGFNQVENQYDFIAETQQNQNSQKHIENSDFDRDKLEIIVNSKTALSPDLNLIERKDLLLRNGVFPENIQESLNSQLKSKTVRNKKVVIQSHLSKDSQEPKIKIAESSNRYFSPADIRFQDNSMSINHNKLFQRKRYSVGDDKSVMNETMNFSKNLNSSTLSQADQNLQHRAIKKSILLPRNLQLTLNTKNSDIHYQQLPRSRQFIEQYPRNQIPSLLDQSDIIYDILEFNRQKELEQDEDNLHLQSKRKKIVQDMTKEEIIEERVKFRQKFQSINNIKRRYDKECCNIPTVDKSVQIIQQLSPNYLKNTMIEKIQERQQSNNLYSPKQKHDKFRFSFSQQRHRQKRVGFNSQQESFDGQKINQMMNDSQIDRAAIFKMCRQDVSQLLKTRTKYRDFEARKRIKEEYFDKLRLVMNIFPSEKQQDKF